MTDHHRVSPDAIELLALLQWPGIGPVKALDVLRARRPEQSIVETARSFYPSVSEAQQRMARERAMAILDRCADLGIGLFAYPDDQFPALLRRIPDPPAIIYVRGDATSLQRRGIAVVGTRKVSSAGARAAAAIAQLLSRLKFNVVSGLALGVDMHAHEAALDAHGTTIAVLAHGLDRVAPSSHKGLASRIVAEGGALISEHAPGVPPRPAEFVRRNRLQSGMSLGSVVVESGLTGGSMHQAKFTHDQGRRLYTVLAGTTENDEDLNEVGARHLMDIFGAIPLRRPADLARELEDLPVPSPGRSIQLDIYR